MFVINPDKFLMPTYRISPFRTDDIGKNLYLTNTSAIGNYLQDRFNGLNYIYTQNGRQAINIALRHYCLSDEDVVTIFTTSGNFYISSCITNEIEKFCKWSREILPETKVLFVNHEFGYPFPDIQELKLLNLPIIEDCAGSFFSEDNEYPIGKIGDFAVYSFPKMFPIQVGGLLVASAQIREIYIKKLPSESLIYIKRVLSNQIQERDRIISQRLSNYKELGWRFQTLGLNERFVLEDGVVPSVFMFRTDNQNLDLPELKQYFWAHGIQSSVFYGEEAFFIPVHQALTEADLDYFFEVMRSFIQNRVK
ncbi:MAG TPA: DegT/DnrJ/EryC1/StrS family aminotransferase [Bacteroidales bacterium]|nr:DegT/DnrJ/EryC1/StrS family aminotransferase [Bacteroidales bacterium]HPR12804.1 DegT/DnrJ/EryC1/StrS family aminotransferase [Bacteroidales bacterium]